MQTNVPLISFENLKFWALEKAFLARFLKKKIPFINYKT